jgi:hypothetical protein
MKFLGMVLAGALLAAPALVKADDPFAGWTDQQLKIKILQLQKENSDLKAQLANGGAAAAAPAPKASADLLLDNFEGATASNGQSWWAGCDSDKLGTTLEPQPFVPSAGGANGSAHSGRIHGHFGVHTGSSYPWAQLTLALSNPDIRGYSAVTFFAKGDGGRYRVQLNRSAVKDYAFPAAEFTAPKEWTLVTLPISGFAQPSWGQSLPVDYKDVEKISFVAITEGSDYDLSIDDLKLAK